MEETGVTGVSVSPVGVYSRPGRDPRGWVVTIAYTAAVDMDLTKVKAGDDARDARWFEILRDQNRITLRNGDIDLIISADRSDPAFDHGEIIADALTKYRS